MGEHLLYAKLSGLTAMLSTIIAGAFYLLEIDGPVRVGLFASFAFSALSVGEIIAYETQELHR